MPVFYSLALVGIGFYVFCLVALRAEPRRAGRRDSPVSKLTADGLRPLANPTGSPVVHLLSRRRKTVAALFYRARTEARSVTGESHDAPGQVTLVTNLRVARGPRQVR